MSKRSSKLLLTDIVTSIKLIEEYTTGLSPDELAAQFMVLHATLYNLQVIGRSIISAPG
jgi:uncharacterized protein with HEPN domain